MPKCDFCPNQAKYDGKTKIGPWAFMCQTHFDSHAIGLGPGRGQVLKVDEVKEKDGKDITG